jgi:hypothetical protein
MTIISIPVREVDGVPSSKTLLAEHNSALQVISHKDQTLVTLRFLSRIVTVEASALQAAIQNTVKDRSSSQHASNSQHA